MASSQTEPFTPLIAFAKLTFCLGGLQPRIEVSEPSNAKALVSTERMLALSA